MTVVFKRAQNKMDLCNFPQNVQLSFFQGLLVLSPPPSFIFILCAPPSPHRNPKKMWEPNPQTKLCTKVCTKNNHQNPPPCILMSISDPIGVFKKFAVVHTNEKTKRMIEGNTTVHPQDSGITAIYCYKLSVYVAPAVTVRHNNNNRTKN